MNINPRSIGTILPSAAVFFLLSVISVSIPAAAATATTGLAVSNFYATPYNAVPGTRVTATVTVHNLDATHPATVSVAVSDGGIVVANSKQLSIAAGGSVTTTLNFKTTTGPSHCYLVSTSPSTVAGATGYCEAGGLLGGAALAATPLLLIVPYLALGALATLGMVGLVYFKTRSRKN